jgi:orotidine-5'-phosphate decarboxylase
MFNTDGSCWLTPGEQDQVIEGLLAYGLIKSDNSRKLPLKSGGMTDVYINLRDCRKSPGATAFLARIFENPLRRLRAERLIEMPSALSGVAGVLSEQLGIPYVTIRDTAKEGRVSDAEIIGEFVVGENSVMFDDVVTDAGTKVPAFRACMNRGVKPSGLVVLVDRQQGWKTMFAKEGIDLPVWAGMTLHDVRKYLVKNGLMRRCDPQVEKNNPIILALDGKPWDEVLPLIDRLRPTGCILKANDLLVTGGINKVISDLSVYGRVMADPKWHDIPSTVENYCKQLRRTPPWAVTVHASGDGEMVKAVAKAMEGTHTIILAVTVLTSIHKDSCARIFGGRTPLKQVEELAAIAREAGASGFVCSGEEAAMLREKYPSVVLVVPGLRSPGADKNEQQRVATFEDAKAAGANFFVGGRQFLGAADPAAEIERVRKDELKME